MLLRIWKCTLTTGQLASASFHSVCPTFHFLIEGQEVGGQGHGRSVFAWFLQQASEPGWVDAPRLTAPQDSNQHGRLHTATGAATHLDCHSLAPLLCCCSAGTSRPAAQISSQGARSLDHLCRPQLITPSSPFIYSLFTTSEKPSLLLLLILRPKEAGSKTGTHS